MTMVAIVVDPDYGSRIEAIQSKMPVWIVNSPANEAAYDWRRSIHPNSAIFNVRDIEARESNLLGVLGDIDDHFGSWCTDEPYERIHVIGLSLSASVAERLTEVGFGNFESADEGFIAQLIDEHQDRGQFPGAWSASADGTSER